MWLQAAHTAPGWSLGLWVLRGTGLCSQSLSLPEAPWTADRLKAKHHDPIRVLDPGVAVIVTNVFHSFTHSSASGLRCVVGSVP